MRPANRDLGSSDAPPPALDRILFKTPVVTIGSFAVDPRDPRFHDSGPIQNHIFVFPRTAVWIRHLGDEAFVANPNIVTIYNRGQLYWRGQISAIGDRCEWFALASDLVLESVRRVDPEVVERPHQPFVHTRARSDPPVFVRQRRLLVELVGDPVPDSLRVEETCVGLLDRVVESAHDQVGRIERRTSRVARLHRELAQDVAAHLAQTFRNRDSLSRLAVEFGVSAGHLCRVFHRQIGQSLHRYRDGLRLRAAFDAIAAGTDLTQLALELGYSSHSHFTAAFRRIFSVVPSEMRRQLARALAGKMGAGPESPMPGDFGWPLRSRT